MIPQNALDRFINSKDSVRNGDNVVLRYANSLAEKTQINSLRSLMRFCWCVKKTPKELMDMAYVKIGEAELKSESDVEKMLDDFETEILRQYKNPNINFEGILTKNMCILIAKAIKGFYGQNKINLGRKTLNNLYNMHIEAQHTYVPTKEDIKKFREHAPEHFKDFISFVTSVCLRREEIAESLTWSKIDLSKPYPMVILKEHELKGHGKGRYEGTLFLGIVAESVRKKFILRKENERKRFEDTKSLYESKGYKFVTPFSEGTHVFTASEVTIDEEKKEVGIYPLSHDAIGDIFEKTQKITKIPLSCHLLRDYVQDMINRYCGQEANSVYANCMLAHKIEGTRRIYSHPEQQYDKVLEVWKMIEPYVDLDLDSNTVSLKLFEKFQELRKKGIPEEDAFKKAVDERIQMLLTQDTELIRRQIEIDLKKAEESRKKRETE
jgi:hypothetical protein